MYYVGCYDQEAPRAHNFLCYLCILEFNKYVMAIIFLINEVSWEFTEFTNLAVIIYVPYINWCKYFKLST